MIYRDDVRDDVAAALTEHGFAGVPVLAIEADGVVRIDFWPSASLPMDLGELRRLAAFRASEGWEREREGITGVIIRDLKVRQASNG